MFHPSQAPPLLGRRGRRVFALKPWSLDVIVLACLCACAITRGIIILQALFDNILPCKSMDPRNEYACVALFFQSQGPRCLLGLSSQADDTRGQLVAELVVRLGLISSLERTRGNWATGDAP